MYVKHNHQCNLTSKMTTCFVFTEFPMVFALSRHAYDQLFDNYKFYPLSNHYCSFCESRDNVRQLTGFAHSTFFTSVYMCHKCFRRIVDVIDAGE